MTENLSGSDAPAWFDWALAHQREEARVTVACAEIEWAAWGTRGRPGVLLLTGNGAHIGWWRPIAPFLAKDYRVAAFSWSGMGKSDWRTSYMPDQFLEEAMAVAEAAGLYEGDDPPVMVGHSFGGFLTIRAAVRLAERLRGVVFIDARLRPRRVWGPDAQPASPVKFFPTETEAIARFHLLPRQPESNRFLLEAWARESLHQTAQGWTWRSDPELRAKTDLGKDMTDLIGKARCPMAFIRGAKSSTVTDEIWHEQIALAPPGTPFVDIPEAHHHVMADQPLALVAALRALLVTLG